MRALSMEEGNIEEHKNYLTLEEEKRRKARVVRTNVQGPLLRWVSKKEEEIVLVQPPPPPAPPPAPAAAPALAPAAVPPFSFPAPVAAFAFAAFCCCAFIVPSLSTLFIFFLQRSHTVPGPCGPGPHFSTHLSPL